MSDETQPTYVEQAKAAFDYVVAWLKANWNTFIVGFAVAVILALVF